MARKFRKNFHEIFLRKAGTFCKCLRLYDCAAEKAGGSGRKTAWFSPLAKMLVLQSRGRAGTIGHSCRWENGRRSAARKICRSNTKKDKNRATFFGAVSSINSRCVFPESAQACFWKRNEKSNKFITKTYCIIRNWVLYYQQDSEILLTQRAQAGRELFLQSSKKYLPKRMNLCIIQKLTKFVLRPSGFKYK